MKLSKLMVAAGFVCLTACGPEMVPAEEVQNGEPANYGAMDYTNGSLTCYSPFWCQGEGRWAQVQWTPSASGGICTVGSLYNRPNDTSELWMVSATATPQEGCFSYYNSNTYQVTSYSECLGKKATWMSNHSC